MDSINIWHRSQSVYRSPAAIVVIGMEIWEIPSNVGRLTGRSFGVSDELFDVFDIIIVL